MLTRRSGGPALQVQLPDVRARPPPLRRSGLLHRCLGFLTPVFLLSDGELVQTAGLDALVGAGQPLVEHACTGWRGRALALSRPLSFPQQAKRPVLLLVACLACCCASCARFAAPHSSLPASLCPPYAQVLTRFLVLGVHIFVPVAALCCAVRESSSVCRLTACLP